MMKEIILLFSVLLVMSCSDVREVPWHKAMLNKMLIEPTEENFIAVKEQLLKDIDKCDGYLQSSGLVIRAILFPSVFAV